VKPPSPLSRRFLGILFLLLSPLTADVREDALVIANEAGQIFQTDPAKASNLAEEAYQLLAKTTGTAQADLAACAGLAARAARFGGEAKRARQWFQKALTHAGPEGSAVLRAELADMLMRSGKLPDAQRALGSPPPLTPPSATLAQWHQTAAKLHLTCGLPEKAQAAINAAMQALPADDTANQVALAIDAAGIALRLDEPTDNLLRQARTKLQTLDSPDPALLSALTSVASQAPDLTEAQSLAILESLDLESLPGDTRLTYSVTLAEAALRNGKKTLTKETLAPVIVAGILPDDHPLLARALSLYAHAADDPKAAQRSSQVSLRWLANSPDSDLLLGLQRTVDPLSPLIAYAPDDLPAAALTAQNFALRQRLHGTPDQPLRQTILYLLYQKDFTQHYGALVFSAGTHWIDLGPAGKIHQRIIDTLDTAERTLAEINTGATLDVRLTQLQKSLWAPLAKHLDPAKPIDIAPVGMLHAVPWATLRRRDGRSLCEILAEVRILALTGTFPTKKINNTFVTCGIASAPGNLPVNGTFPFDDELAHLIGTLPELPGVALEIAKLRGTSYLDPNRARFLSLLGTQPGTLHLAGHGFVIESEEGTGFRAGFVLAGGGEESILFARDIATLDLSGISLIVLSACRGGLGRGEVGGNWSSLRRSFIAAGARQVLAAQWRVRDDKIPAFMTAFHRRRLTAPPHLALWLLQRELVKDANEIDLASAGAWILESRP